MSSLSCGTLYSTTHLHFTFLPFVAFLGEVGCIFVLALRSQFVKNGRSRVLTLRVFSSGGLAGGSYPFSFRTRQSSLLAAMVLIVTDGESS